MNDNDPEELENEIEETHHTSSTDRLKLKLLYLILMEIRDWRRVRKERF